jgi:hypothetical protein
MGQVVSAERPSFYPISEKCRVRGSLCVLILYDVAEGIRLELLGGGNREENTRREPSFKHPAPDYVRFERPPAVESTGPIKITGGEQFQTRIKYFDYGVVCVELELSFDADWDELTRLSYRWIGAPELERATLTLVRQKLNDASGSLVQPNQSWLSEDYYVVHLTEALDEKGRMLSGAALIAEYGDNIAQIVRGERVSLSAEEREEALRARISYYPNDLLVAGWVAAVIYDSKENAAPMLQLLEYANTQLLEYRHYDEVLTKVLKQVYAQLERKGSLLRMWRMGREAKRLNTLRLDVTELTERTDNAIKFLSDMFYARAYKIASGRVGVQDYRNLVDQKLRTARDLYEFMLNEFHHARAFLLEAMVVAILVIELFHLFQ